MEENKHFLAIRTKVIKKILNANFLKCKIQVIYSKASPLVLGKDERAIRIYLYLEAADLSSLFDTEPERAFKVIY